MRHARHRPEAVKSAIAVGGAFLLVVLMAAAGWLLLRPGPPDGGPLAADHTDTSAAPTTAEVTTPPPAVTTTTARPSPTRRVLPKPTRGSTSAPKDKPPAPTATQPPKTSDCPTYVGTAASKADVKAALLAAGARQYWVGVVPPSNLEVPLPSITIPANLMKAIAWQESGWQSNIIACDYGTGTMQMMAGTAEQVNNRFGESYDMNTLSGNTTLAAMYLEWLIMWYGTNFYSQHFDLDTVAALGPNGEPVRMLDAVIASYNVGPGTIANDTTKIIAFNEKGSAYRYNVLALMQNCPCSAF